jgi:hypothetical protein
MFWLDCVLPVCFSSATPCLFVYVPCFPFLARSQCCCMLQERLPDQSLVGDPAYTISCKMKHLEPLTLLSGPTLHCQARRKALCRLAPTHLKQYAVPCVCRALPAQSHTSMGRKCGCCNRHTTWLILRQAGTNRMQLRMPQLPLFVLSLLQLPLLLSMCPFMSIVELYSLHAENM